MKKYFSSGFVTLLPIVMTILIVVFFVNLLTKPFVDIVESFISQFPLENTPFHFLNHPAVINSISKILILIFLFFVTVLFGIIANWFFVHSLIKWGDFLLHRLPLFNKIYKACQDVIHTLFSTNNKTFKEVVLVPFPNTSGYSIGLVTQDNVQLTGKETHEELISVFVPATPNPTMGFILLYHKSQVIPVSMSIEEGLKTVVSGGIIMPSFSTKILSNKNSCRP